MLFALMATLLQASGIDTIPVWTPHRAYDSQHKRFSDFESLAAEAAGAQVVFFGEQHDNAGTHRMERALLEAVARRRQDVVLSLEMFERDVQPILNQYLGGTISEADFLAAARPWPNYATDYRPLVEFAKAHHWRVIAADIPRPMASAVATQGMAAMTGRTDSTRSWAAAEFTCDPSGKYFERFRTAMGDHPMGTGAMPTLDNMYRAQCVKDETMAESIARVERDDTPPLIIHVTGAFHADFGEGTVERTRRRLGKTKILVISAVPVPALDSIRPDEWRKQGDWILFTLQ